MYSWTGKKMKQLSHPDFSAGTLVLIRQFQKAITADDDAVIPKKSEKRKESLLKKLRKTFVYKKF